MGSGFAPQEANRWEELLSSPGGYTFQSVVRFSPSNVILVGLLVASAVGGAGQEIQTIQELSEALAHLESPVRSQRQRAQIWLDENLKAEHAQQVAGVLAAGAETERRLALILGGSDRHFALAAELLGFPTVAARTLGKEGLTARYLAWNPGGVRQLQPWVEVRGGLSDPPGEEFFMALKGLPLGEAVDQLDRLGGAPLPLILDPRWPYPGPVASLEDSGLQGPWASLFHSLARYSHRKLMFLPGAGGTKGDLGQGAMLLMVPDGLDNPMAGVQIPVQWIALVRKVHAPASNRGAAMALARSGWPAALIWLGELFAADEGSPVVDALLDAGARGVWCDSICRREALMGVLARLEQAPPDATIAGWLRAGRLARALRSMGSVDQDGLSLVSDLVAGLSTSSEMGQWVRLQGLGAMASPLGVEQDQAHLIKAARVAMLRPGHGARRLAALTWLCRLGSPRSGNDLQASHTVQALDDPWTLLTWAARSRAAIFVPGALVDQGWIPPPGLLPLRAAHPGAWALHCHWLLAAGEVERALDVVPEGDQDLVRMVEVPLGEMNSGASQATRERFLEGLRMRGRGVAAGHLELGLDPARNLVLGERLLAKETAQREPLDWISLGHLAARGPLKARAQDLVIEGLKDPLLGVDALEPLLIAWTGMLADRQDVAADEFLARMEEALGPGAVRAGTTLRDILQTSFNRPIHLQNRDVAWQPR